MRGASSSGQVCRSLRTLRPSLLGLPEHVVPADSLPELALSNARSGDPDAAIIFKEKRTVNGVEVWFLKIDTEVNKVPIILFSANYGGKGGNVQIITYTGRNRLVEYEKDFIEFLNGLWVSE